MEFGICGWPGIMADGCAAPGGMDGAPDGIDAGGADPDDRVALLVLI